MAERVQRVLGETRLSKQEVDLTYNCVQNYEIRRQRGFPFKENVDPRVLSVDERLARLTIEPVRSHTVTCINGKMEIRYHDEDEKSAPKIKRSPDSDARLMRFLGPDYKSDDDDDDDDDDSSQTIDIESERLKCIEQVCKAEMALKTLDHNCATRALDYYNQKYDTDFVLVEGGRAFDGNTYLPCHHINFTAKPKSDLEGEEGLALFFADLSYRKLDVHYCEILGEAGYDIGCGCPYCPGEVIHPIKFKGYRGDDNCILEIPDESPVSDSGSESD